MNCSYTTIPITDIPDITSWTLTSTNLSITIANETRATDF